ncbi:MAG: DUF3887 domain-containing protein, partial [Phycisphaerae bacterium]|nr:DUF3887 domain-containing protein [Phycisphaerae bacterium]
MNSVISIRYIFEWVMLTSMQASILIGLILIIQAGLRGRLAGRWHYGLWLLVVIRLIMPWVPQSRLSIYNLTSVPSMPPIRAQTPIMDGYLTFNNLVPEHGVIAPLAVAPAIDKPIEIALEDRHCSVRANQPVVQDDRWRAWTVLPAVWLGGILVFLTIIFSANLRLWLKVRREKIVTHPQALELLADCMEQMGIAGKNPLVVVATDQVYSPSLFGSIHPRLLLPKGLLAGLNASQLRHIFLHELAHLKRRDIQMGWLTTLLQIVHWFNPLLWYAFYRMRVEREIACDAMVFTALHSEQPQKYGQTIVRLLECFSQRRPLPSLVGMLESRFHLKRRIAMIANFKRNTKNSAWLTAGLMIMLACVAMTSARESKQPSKMELKTQGQAFVELLTSGQYEEAAKDFDDNMTRLMGEKRLAEKWQSLVANIQPFKRQLVARPDKYQNYDVVLVTCEFEKGPVDVMLVYDSERKISGLHFLPTPMAVWNQYRPATSHKTPGRVELKSVAQEPTIISSHPNSMAQSSGLPKEPGLTKRQVAEAMEVQRLNKIDSNTQQRVNSLMMSAKEFRGMQEYEKAAMIIDRVLEIEPRHHQATRQKGQLKDLIFFKKQLNIAKGSDSETSKVLTDVNPSAIPASKRYQFPEDWQEKTA